MLTDRRALIDRTGMMSRSFSVDLRTVADLHPTTEFGDLGAVRSGPAAPLLGFDTGGISVRVPALDASPRFAMLREARRLFDLALD